MKAICSPTCENGGICRKPNKCACSPGWTGSTCQTVNLHVIPEYQKFLHGYQELNQRIVMLEKMQEQHNLTDLEYQVEKIAKSVSSMTEKDVPSYSSDKTKTDNYAYYGSPWERVHSLSEQISMLEERLADCTCNQPERSRPRL
ncbi:epidermal growth factor-like protein 8 isoform X2 [Limulus polyphemus]|uniref:Epidermal growth factor-like protein 8 isoform X2 n=1 Tax=Limulus polyphemus TaxID=6850 RepID=A0ABM1TDC2_LIMPO|nr:epidermal growth factor-like protein 8 isoform X2 [Limulus polyphemus]